MRIVFSENPEFNKMTYEDQSCKIYFKGYALIDEKLYFGDEFIPIIKKYIEKDVLISSIPKMNGVFNIIVNKNDELIVATDRLSPFHLFYKKDNRGLSISDNWHQLDDKKELNTDAVVEYIAFGYVLGTKTLINNINEFESHHIYKFRIEFGNILEKKINYWQYAVNPGKKDNLEYEFYRLWKKQIRIYTDYIKNNKKRTFIPITGGLDSRIIAYEFDNENIAIKSMTYGNNPSNLQIQTALKIIKRLNSVSDHQLLFMNSAFINSVRNNVDFHKFDITCGHLEKILSHNRIYKNSLGYFHIPGHSGDFIAGSHLKQKMKYWKTKTEIIDYIIKRKSTPFGYQLLSQNKKQLDKVTENLEELINIENGYKNGFLEWNFTNRQRRFITRSCIPEYRNKTPQVLLPFFDYELIDFFIKVPFDLLFYEKLYINSFLKYFFEDNKDLRKIPKDGNPIKPIKNVFIKEYHSKIKKQFLKKFKKGSNTKMWSGNPIKYEKNHEVFLNKIGLNNIPDNITQKNLLYIDMLLKFSKYEDLV
ncbi:MAG: hypothetical protein ACOCV1_06840 [Bacillota bacterium]